jgi:23S rRNA pseudouridine1911/1915/1917 synthase
LVHRLDQPVAGVMLFCRTSKAAGRISEQFRLGHVKKRYVAIVEGSLAHDTEKLVHHLERREKSSSRVVAGPGPRSQEARLSYRVLERNRSRTLIEVDLETGRHHQIRIQMSHRGHPLLGDLRYGASAPLPNRQIALVATELHFTHPVSKTSVRLSCPLPRDWPWPSGQPRTDGPPWLWEELLPSVLP